MYLCREMQVSSTSSSSIRAHTYEGEEAGVGEGRQHLVPLHTQRIVRLIDYAIIKEFRTEFM